MVIVDVSEDAWVLRKGSWALSGKSEDRPS